MAGEVEPVRHGRVVDERDVVDGGQSATGAKEGLGVSEEGLNRQCVVVRGEK